MQDANAKEILGNMLQNELNWIASLSISSDKSEVKEKAVKWILHSFKRSNIVLKYGSGGISYDELIPAVRETNIYHFASIVDAAETEQEFIRLIKDEWKDDTSMLSLALTRTWKKTRNLFQIMWNFRFPFPKEREGESIFRRVAQQKRTRKSQQAEAPAAERHWTDYIPEKFREIVQLASNLPEKNIYIFKMLERETRPFQRTLIKTILENPYNEEAIHEWAIRIRHEGKGEHYEMRIKNITLELIKMGVKI